MPDRNPWRGVGCVAILLILLWLAVSCFSAAVSTIAARTMS